MSSNTICSSCLRAMRRHAHSTLKQQTPSHRIRLQPRPQNQQHSTPIRRALTTSSHFQQKSSDKSQVSRSASQSPQQSPPPPPTPAAFQAIASTLRSSPTLRSTTEPYIAYGSTEDLFRQCAAQCTYTIPSALSHPPGQPPQNDAGDHLGEGEGWWLEPKPKGGLGLEPTFNSWAQVLFLHMWMLTVRFRCFPEKYVKDWHQNLLDHFFYAAEDRMATWHGMSARGVRNKNLKDLWLQWRGIQLGYDEGVIKGDAVLATAIWRNLFKASEGVDMHDVAIVTAYVYRELQMLGKLEDTMVTEGRVQFGDPKTLIRLVGAESPAMRLKLTQEDLKAPEKLAKEG